MSGDDRFQQGLDGLSAIDRDLYNITTRLSQVGHTPKEPIEQASQSGLQGLLERYFAHLVYLCPALQQVDSFVSGTARLNGQLEILEQRLPETAPESRLKR